MNKQVSLSVVMILFSAAAAAPGFAAGAEGTEVAFQLPYNGFQSGANRLRVPAEPLSSGAIRNITFKNNISITDALHFLAVKYKRNIVPSAEVKGKLAFSSLFDVTFDEALNAILGDKYEYVSDGELIRVYTREEYQKIQSSSERMVYKVYTLSYIGSDEAKRLITPVLSTRGKIQASTSAQTGVPTAASISTSVGGGNSIALNDMLIVYDYPENIQEATKVIESIDQRPRQVLVEATILSANLTEDMELGVDLNMTGGVHLDGTSGTSDLTSGDTVDRGSSATTPVNQIAGGINGSDALIETSGFASVGGNGLRVGVTAGNIGAFITALESITDITLLANPRILAVNKQLGQVYIGNKLGYREGDVETAAGGTQQGEVKFLDTGTKLAFRPYIGNDGYIRMDIHPKDSSGSLNASGVPNEDSAELATNIMVRDGETIVIGGLFREVVTSTESQVPLLGSLPLLGPLFRNVTDSTKRQEVIVLLTPHIVTDTSELSAEEEQDDIDRKRDAAISSLHYPGSASLAEDFYSDAVKCYVKGKNAKALEKLKWALRFRPTFLEALKLRDKITNNGLHSD
mgnify:CR=1 FL=1